MGNKVKHIRIRITEVQIERQLTKSEILRDALNRYLVENIRKDKINNNGNQKLTL
jgi:hypothetical protein